MDTSRRAEEDIASQAQKTLQTFIKESAKKAKEPKNIITAGEDVVSILPAMLSDIIDLVKLVENTLANLDLQGVVSFFQDLSTNKATNFPQLAEPLRMLYNVDTGIAKAFIKVIVEDAMGVNLSPDGVDTTEALDTIGQSIAFINQIQLITAALSFVGKLGLGEKWSEKAAEFIKEIPGEIGLNFAVGTLLSTIFEQAIGRPIEEAINISKSPNRLDWRVMKALFKQHILKDDEIDWELTKQGYPKELRGWIKQLDKAQLPITDVQSAWLYGILDDKGANDYLDALGYDAEDKRILTEVYLKHSGTQADSIYRSVARRLRTNNSISETQFRTILEAADTPKRSIDIEVAAINLEHQYGRLELSIAEVKKMYLDGPLTRPEAQTELVNHGYDSTDASALINEWDTSPTKKRKTLTASQVLRYLVAGVIKVDEARTRLLNIGYNTKDADFLIAHPYVKTPKAVTTQKSGTIVQAYKDGIIQVNEAYDELYSLNIDPVEISELLQIASYQMTHTTHAKPVVKRLSEGDIKEAYNLGMLHDYDAETRLIDIGYSSDDAGFLVLSWYLKNNPAANKGEQSLSYLQSLLTPLPTANQPQYQNPSFLAINNQTYRVYVYNASLLAPPNSTEYMNTFTGLYYWILNGDPVPSGWQIVTDTAVH